MAKALPMLNSRRHENGKCQYTMTMRQNKKHKSELQLLRLKLSAIKANLKASRAEVAALKATVQSLQESYRMAERPIIATFNLKEAGIKHDPLLKKRVAEFKREWEARKRRGRRKGKGGSTGSSKA